MKRALALLGAGLMLLSLCACGGTNPGTATAAPTVLPAAASPEPTPEPPAPSPVKTPEPTPQPTPEPTAEVTAEPSPEVTAEPGTEETLEVSMGGRLHSYASVLTELELHPGISCTVLLPVQEMTAAYTENAWQLRSTEKPEDGFLELSYIAGTTAEELLPGLMDGYLDFTDIEFSNDSSVGRMSKTFGYADAANNELRAEGWVLDADGGVVAIVLVCRQDCMDTLGNLLHAVLGSFALL